jgi:hypothetical protein
MLGGKLKEIEYSWGAYVSKGRPTHYPW